MKKHKIRLIPVLTFNGISLVKTKQFGSPRTVGNPVQSARVFNMRSADELIFLDITASRQERKINLKLVKEVLNECFMPVGVGGGINTLEDINDLLRIGADKVVLKTAALLNPAFVKQAAKEFGSQCICIAVDVINLEGQWKIHNLLGIDKGLEDFIKEMEDLGAGEFFITSVAHEGMMAGFNFDLARKVNGMSRLPIIFNGGAKDPESFAELLGECYFEGIAASSIFSFTQFTNLDVISILAQKEFPVREL
jgi:imidazole glycerol-phosphate synthase subunit HisF